MCRERYNCRDGPFSAGDSRSGQPVFEACGSPCPSSVRSPTARRRPLARQRLPHDRAGHRCRGPPERQDRCLIWTNHACERSPRVKVLQARGPYLSGQQGCYLLKPFLHHGGGRRWGHHRRIRQCAPILGLLCALALARPAFRQYARATRYRRGMVGEDQDRSGSRAWWCSQILSAGSRSTASIPPSFATSQLLDLIAEKATSACVGCVAIHANRPSTSLAGRARLSPHPAPALTVTPPGSTSSPARSPAAPACCGPRTRSRRGR